MESKWSLRVEDVFRSVAPGVLMVMAVAPLLQVPELVMLLGALVFGPILYSWVRSTCLGGFRAEGGSKLRAALIGDYDGHVIEIARAYARYKSLPGEERKAREEDPLESFMSHLDEMKTKALGSYKETFVEANHVWCLMTCAVAAAVGCAVRFVLACAIMTSSGNEPTLWRAWWPVVGWGAVFFMLRTGANRGLKAIRSVDLHLIRHGYDLNPIKNGNEMVAEP
jgi:hypothetical protein